MSRQNDKILLHESERPSIGAKARHGRKGLGQECLRIPETTLAEACSRCRVNPRLGQFLSNLHEHPPPDGRRVSFGRGGERGLDSGSVGTGHCPPVGVQVAAAWQWPARLVVHVDSKQGPQSLSSESSPSSP